MLTPFAASAFIAGSAALEINDSSPSYPEDFSLLKLSPPDFLTHDIAHFFGTNNYQNTPSHHSPHHNSGHYSHTSDGYDHNAHSSYSDLHHYHESSSSHFEYSNFDDFKKYHHNDKSIAENEAFVYSILPLTIHEKKDPYSDHSSISQSDYE